MGTFVAFGWLLRPEVAGPKPTYTPQSTGVKPEYLTKEQQTKVIKERKWLETVKLFDPVTGMAVVSSREWGEGLEARGRCADFHDNHWCRFSTS